MRSYATRLAQELAPDALQPEWVPYFPSPVSLDHIRFLASDEDPVWPHRRFFAAAEWEMVRRIDGDHTIGEIASKAAKELEECTGLFWKLHLKGFVLFAEPPERWRERTRF